MSERQGLVIVHTGSGKGKTTASLGMALRAWGQGMKVLMIQFIKGGSVYGEMLAADRLPGFEIRPVGEGFIRGAGEEEMARHRQSAAQGLEMARQEIVNGNWDMIILDEINYAVGFGLFPLQDVLNIIEEKPPKLHLVLTGRNAAREVIEKAHLVTEMTELKHPFAGGIPAQKGIEF